MDIGNSESAVKLIKEHPEIALTNTTRERGLPLLSYAARENLKDVVKALLDAKASPDIPGGFGETALHWAIYRDIADLEIIEILLNYHADVNAQDEYGMTPLHLAVRSHNLAVIGLLLEMGANPTILSNEGDTPESLARERGDPPIIKLLDNPPPLKREVGQRPRRTVRFSRPEPDYDMRTICLHFKGVQWFPSADSQPTVWDLIYEDTSSGGFPAKRWIHLPSNNVSPQSSNTILNVTILLTAFLSHDGFR
jgi:hypothetical protein